MGYNLAQLEPEPLKPLPVARVSSGLIGLAFTLAVFLSAGLLFVVEPMFGKMVLPLLGGSPAVWTTCMLFFQGALLVGYLYAHMGPRWLGLRRHTVLHIVLLALCFLLLPIGVAETGRAFRLDHPTIWLLWILTLSLGPPFVLLSSTGPLLQVWFSKTAHPQADRPYFLYAASNAGSLLALLSYPFLLEPMIPLKGQARLWRIGYVGLVILVGISAAYLRAGVASGKKVSLSADPAPGVGTGQILRWIVLAFVPSSFFLALTTYLTTDVAAVPLLWIIPLVLYLLSFTLVFGGRTPKPWVSLVRWQRVGLIAVVVLDFWVSSYAAPLLLPLHLIVFFITALVCHGELATIKPPAARLTEFYLTIAVGGVLGGVFNALIAPALFDSVLEYPLTLLVACMVAPHLSEKQLERFPLWDLAIIAFACMVLVWTRVHSGNDPALGLAIVASGVAAVMCLRASRDPKRFALAIGGVVIAGIMARAARSGVLLTERNFFGVREVQEVPQQQMRLLMHGTTKHGAQSTDPARRREPTSYYYRQGPAGDLFGALPPTGARKVAVVGLGAGALAAYAGAGEQWTFYEIDPAIARLARDTRYFTYLQDTPANVQLILGDGRLSLAEAPDHRYDIIVLDAFSSDAIPLHLLTQEALHLYQSKLSESGVILFHLSNRYLELEPVLGRLIGSAGLAGLIRVNTAISRDVLECGGDPSIWAVVAPRDASLGFLRTDKRWRPLRLRNDVGLWTDDFSNIFRVFHLPRKASTSSSAPRPDNEVTSPQSGSGAGQRCNEALTAGYARYTRSVSLPFSAPRVDTIAARHRNADPISAVPTSRRHGIPQLTQHENP